MPQPLYLLFDIDGTLIDAAGAGRLSLDLALEHEFSLRREQHIPLQGRTDLGIFTEYLEQHSIEANAENLQRFRQAYLDQLPRQMHLRPGKICPGVEELLPQLSNDPRFKLGLLTGNSLKSATIKLSHFRIEHWFSFGIYGQQALRRIDLAPEIPNILKTVADKEWTEQQVVVIGDTPDDVALGKAVRARTIAVATGGHPLTELEEAKPCVVLDDLQNGFTVLENFLV